MGERIKFGLCLFVVGVLLVLYPYPDDYVKIDVSHCIHGNLYQHFGVETGLSFIVTSFSLITQRYTGKKLSFMLFISGVIIFIWTSTYIRIQGGFLDFFDGGGFGYSKLIIKAPEMVFLQYVSVIISTIGFSGLFQLLPQNEEYIKIKPKSSDPEFTPIVES